MCEAALKLIEEKNATSAIEEEDDGSSQVVGRGGQAY